MLRLWFDSNSAPSTHLDRGTTSIWMRSKARKCPSFLDSRNHPAAPFQT
jgi:hypothetical protein